MFLKRLVTVMLVLAAVSLQDIQAQTAKPQLWSGKFAIKSGSNYQRAESYGYPVSSAGGEASVFLSRTSEKLKISLDLGYSTYYNATQKLGESFDRKDGGGYIFNLLDLIYTESDKRKINGALDFLWTPDNNNSFNFTVSHITDMDFPLSSISKNDEFEMERDNYDFVEDELKDILDYTYTYQEGRKVRNTETLTASWRHSFDKAGRKLFAVIGWKPSWTDDSTEWTQGTGKTDYFDDYTEDKIWRITPKYVEGDLNAEISFEDKDIFGVKNLDGWASLKTSVQSNDDSFSASNKVGPQWVDSTSYRERFEYDRIIVTPKFHVSWHGKRFSVDATASPEYFTDCLTDTDHSGSFGKGSLLLLYDMSLRYGFNGGHSVGLNAKRNIARPQYLSLCWFPRTGSDAEELTRGNPFLLPIKTYTFNLDYMFRKGRFSSVLELGENLEQDRIENTFSREILDDREYRVYTWINAGWSSALFARLALKWQGERLKAEIGGLYNYQMTEDKDGNRAYNSDYNLSGSLLYDFGKGWSAETRLRYQSKIIRSYTTITEYVGCDIRVDKKFGKRKRFGLFIDIKDLFDNDIRTEIISEDRSQVRVEVQDYNRRLFSLGATYSF